MDRRLRSKFILLTLIALISAMAITSCATPAPQAEPAAPQTAAPQAAPAEPQPAAPAAEQPAAPTDFELNVAVGADPVNLDPRLTWVGAGYSVNYHVMEPLVARKMEGSQVSLQGLLAESWEQRDDLTWVFHLREGVKFHNGEPLTGDAVKFTMESLADPEFTTPLKTWVSDIDTVTVEDPLTVVIKTKYPTRGLLTSLVQVSIVEPKAVESMGNANYNTAPIGTGPYKLASYIPNNQIVLERNDEYWGTKGKAKKIVWRVMPENSTRIAALQAGEVDIAENIPPDKVSTIEADENLMILAGPNMRVDFIEILFTNPWLEQLKFRQAISYAIDRQSIVDNILGGTTIVASSPSPPGTIGFNEDLPKYEYNLEKAKQLLKEIGYNGDPILFGAPSGRYAMDRQIGEAVAEMLKEAGINVQLEVLDWSSFYPKRSSYNMFYLGQTDFTLNPNKHFSTVFYSATNETGYSNPEVDALLDEAIKTMDDGAAAEIYKRVQALLVADMASIPLHYEPSLVGVNKRVKNFELRLDEYIVVSNVEPAN